MPETKPKQGDAMRTPKPKKKLGLVVPPSLKLPHEDLISPAVEPEQKENESLSMTSQTSMPSPSSLTSQTRHTSEEEPVAPQRDYMKMANSIGREAVPAGLFTGKSKQLYDCLYSMTRGAIVPTRTVRISRPKLMAKANIGSRATFEANIDRLLAVGLVTVRKITGEHEGNEYTVNLPEEIESTMPSQTSQTSLTRYAQKLVRLVRLETSQTRHTLSPINSTSSGVPKTSFKTNKRNDDDDAALAGLFSTLREATKQVTGREISAAESERWRELGEVLATELKIAAARTTVSSAPAFLAEHLRRRLWNKDKKQLVEEQKAEQTESAEKPQLTPEQLRECPDCFGTGMYYPEGIGFGKAVARCRHERLKREVE